MRTDIKKTVDRRTDGKKGSMTRGLTERKTG